MALDYANLSDRALGSLFAEAFRDIRKDEMRKEDDQGNKSEGLCKRVRGLPLHVSQDFALRLRDIAVTQKEVERLFYGYEDSGDSAAEGRKARRYETASGAMPIWRARDSLCALAWGAFLTGNDDWWLEATYWRTRFDAIEAARPILKDLARRKNACSHASGANALDETLRVFRKSLVKAAATEDDKNRLRLASFIVQDRTRLEQHLQKFGLNVTVLQLSSGLFCGTSLSH